MPICPGEWIGDESKGPERKVIAPPSGVVNMRLQVTLDGLLAVRSTLDGMADKMNRGTTPPNQHSSQSGSRPHSRLALLDGVDEFHATNLDLMRVGTPTRHGGAGGEYA